jgi:peptidyl-prolyl cis-trans isomerase C
VKFLSALLLIAATLSLAAASAFAADATSKPTAAAPAAAAPAAAAPAASAPAAAASSAKQSPTDVVARVNGKDITRQDLDFAASEVGAQLASFPPSERDRVLLQFVIQNDLMASAAEKDKLDKDPDFEARLKYHRLRALRDEFYDHDIQGAVSVADAKTIYDAKIKDLKPVPEIRARHILVDTEAEAKEIKKELDNGADFATLAKEKSKDAAVQGGDLGFFSRGQMVKSFEDAAFALKVGQISDPVHTQFGWHIIEVTAKRNRPVPTFDEVKDAIMGKLLEAKSQEVIGKLEQDAKVEILDPTIKKAMQDAAMRGEAPAADAGQDDSGNEDVTSGH